MRITPAWDVKVEVTSRVDKSAKCQERGRNTRNEVWPLELAQNTNQTQLSFSYNLNTALTSCPPQGATQNQQPPDPSCCGWINSHL